MSRKSVPIAHTGRAGGVSGVRLRGDVSGAEFSFFVYNFVILF
jgi:hypothetical protein